MAKVVYKIVKHENGWAYKARGTFSETFPSHDARSQRRGPRPARRKCRARPSASNMRRQTASGMRNSIPARTGPRPGSRTIEMRLEPKKEAADRRDQPPFANSNRYGQYHSGPTITQPRCSQR